jgi:hypothetical protein
MTPLRWHWSANTRCSLKSRRISDLPSRLQRLTTYEVALAAPNDHFERALVAACAEDLRGVWPDARGASHAPTGPLGRQLTDTMVEHRSLALPPSLPLGR